MHEAPAPGGVYDVSDRLHVPKMHSAAMHRCLSIGLCPIQPVHPATRRSTWGVLHPILHEDSPRKEPWLPPCSGIEDRKCSRMHLARSSLSAAFRPYDIDCSERVQSEIQFLIDDAWSVWCFHLIASTAYSYIIEVFCSISL